MTFNSSPRTPAKGSPRITQLPSSSLSFSKVNMVPVIFGISEWKGNLSGKRSTSFNALKDQFLHSSPGIHFSGVQVAFTVGIDAVQPDKLPRIATILAD